MTADLLRWEDIRDQIRVIKRARSVDDPSIINALIEISSSLYDLQFMERATDSRGVLHIIERSSGLSALSAMYSSNGLLCLQCTWPQR